MCTHTWYGGAAPNAANITPSRPDSGFGMSHFGGKNSLFFQGVPSLLGSGVRELGSTQWTTTFSSKVNLPLAITFRGVRERQILLAPSKTKGGLARGYVGLVIYSTFFSSDGMAAPSLNSQPQTLNPNLQPFTLNSQT